MSPLSDISSESSGETSSGSPPSSPPNWRKALMDLIASRIALIELESQDLVRERIHRGSFFVIACGFSFFAWALLLAGGISWVAESTGCPWNQVAVGAAILHLLGGILFARLAKPSPATAFPVTRAEFQKDREWIENFQKSRKSND